MRVLKQDTWFAKYQKLKGLASLVVFAAMEWIARKIYDHRSFAGGSVI
jgi:hypothetical protein